jgi:PKHD-type hydroxylase
VTFNYSSLKWILRNEKQFSVVYENAFSEEEVEKIKILSGNFQKEIGNATAAQKIRVSNISWIEPALESEWVYRKLVDLIHNANASNFNLNLLGMEALQFTEYESKDSGFYGVHVDSLPTQKSKLNRKLSFSVQLTNENDYEGGELVLDYVGEQIVASKKIGTIIFFESSARHSVKPVTKGIRHSLVGWVCGPEAV